MKSKRAVVAKKKMAWKKTAKTFLFKKKRTYFIVEDKITSSKLCFVVQPQTNLTKIILPKLAAWLLVEEHSTGKHVVIFFQKKII